MVNGKTPLYLTVMAMGSIGAAVAILQPYTADFPGTAYAQPARRYLRAAIAQDSAGLDPDLGVGAGGEVGAAGRPRASGFPGGLGWADAHLRHGAASRHRGGTRVPGQGALQRGAHRAAVHRERGRRAGGAGQLGVPGVQAVGASIRRHTRACGARSLAMPFSCPESSMSGMRMVLSLLVLLTSGCSKHPRYGPVAPQDTAQVRPEERPTLPGVDPT